MRRLVVMLLVATATVHAAPRRYGAIVGVRATDITGDVASDPYPSVALAADIELHRGPSLSLSIEPGIRWNGTAAYRMIYGGLPVVATFRFAPVDEWRFRASAGVVPSLLAYGYLVYELDGEGNVMRDGISEHLRRWDVEVLAGIGVEHGWYFVDLRAARGLVTVHADEPTLFAVHQELGVWFGVLR